ncbi:MAG TPA: hypothetical protein VFY84_01490 [Jiangellales bacterium]|nr:hypothetical protein [Jiangellales bacterium]
MTGFSPTAVGPEVWLAAGYCLALVGLAYVIDGLARRAASVSEGGLSGGFTYHADHDAWRCPEDQWLWPTSFDPDNRVMRYRGTPAVCNACPVKDTCTTSHSGREIQRTVDVWPASEAARFHRGIACAVVVLGLVWPLGTALTGPGGDALLVLGGAVVAATLLSLPLWSHLRRTEVFIPEGMLQRSLDDVVAERRMAAAALARRRSSFRSDRRETGKEAVE